MLFQVGHIANPFPKFSPTQGVRASRGIPPAKEDHTLKSLYFCMKGPTKFLGGQLWSGAPTSLNIATKLLPPCNPLTVDILREGTT